MASAHFHSIFHTARQPSTAGLAFLRHTVRPWKLAWGVVDGETRAGALLRKSAAEAGDLEVD